MLLTLSATFILAPQSQLCSAFTLNYTGLQNRPLKNIFIFLIVFAFSRGDGRAGPWLVCLWALRSKLSARFGAKRKVGPQTRVAGFCSGLFSCLLLKKTV